MGSAARGQPSYGARAETRPTEHRARRQPLRATFPSQGRCRKRPATDVGKRRIGDQEARPQRFQKTAAGGKPDAFRRGELPRTAVIRQNLQVPLQPRRRGSEARPRRRMCRPGRRTAPRLSLIHILPDRHRRHRLSRLRARHPHARAADHQRRGPQPVRGGIPRSQHPGPRPMCIRDSHIDARREIRLVVPRRLGPQVQHDRPPSGSPSPALSRHCGASRPSGALPRGSGDSGQEAPSAVPPPRGMSPG